MLHLFNRNHVDPTVLMTANQLLDELLISEDQHFLDVLREIRDRIYSNTDKAAVHELSRLVDEFIMIKDDYNRFHKLGRMRDLGVYLAPNKVVKED